MLVIVIQWKFGKRARRALSSKASRPGGGPLTQAAAAPTRLGKIWRKLETNVISASGITNLKKKSSNEEENSTFDLNN